MSRDFNVKINFSATGTGQTAGGARQVSDAMRDVETSARSMMTSLAGMAATLGASFSFVAAARSGIEFNRVMEDSRSGLAALIMASHDFTDATGKAVSSQRALSSSFEMAEGLQKRLLQSAKTTAASYTDLVQAFQTAYGPATAAGITNLGKLEQVVVSGSQAVAALGLDSRQTSQELRALFTGEQGPDNTLNRTLGITKAQLDEVRKSGGDVADFLLSKLKPFAESAGASMTNFSVVLSNTKDALEQMLGEATRPLFVELKTAIGGASATVDELKGRISSIAQVAAGVVKDFAPLGGAILEAFVSGLKAVADFVDILRPLAPILKDVVDGVRTVTEAFGGLGVAIGLATVAMMRFSGTTAIGAVTAGLSALQGLAAAAVAELTAVTGVSAAAAGAVLSLGAAIVVGFTADRIWEFIKAWRELRAETEKADQSVTASVDSISKAFDRIAKSSQTDLGWRKWAADWAASVKAGNVAVEDGSKALHWYAEEIATVGKTAEGVKVKAKDVVDQEALKRAAAEAAKLAEAIKRTADAYGKSLDQMRRRAEEALPDVVAKIGLLDPEVREIQKAFDEASQTVAEYAFATGKRMDEVGARLRKWRDDALIALTDPFKKALPVARSYMDVVMGIPGQVTKPKAGAGTLDALVEDAIEAGKYIEAAFTTAAEAALAAGDGLRAGWEEVLARIPSAAQSAARGVQDAWTALTRGLETVFFDALLGKFDSFGDVMKGMGQDIASSIARSFSEAVQRIISGLSSIGEEWSKMTTAPSTTGGYVSGAIGGAALGYSMGSATGGKYAQIYGAVLGLVGSFFGQIGQVIGAALGTILGHQFDLTEIQKYFGNGMDLSGMPNALQKAQRVFMEKMGRFFEFAAPTHEEAFALRRDFERAIRLFMGGYTVHAGSEEDFKADLEKLFAEILPRDLLRLGFGQTIPQAEVAGITRSRAWDYNGEAGDLFDPEAPIPKLLAGLGFTAERIGAIADEIARGVDPEEIWDEIQDLVQVVIGFRDLGAALSKTAEEFWNDLDGASKKPASVGFKEWADDLVTLSRELSEYGGNEQREKAKELIELGNEYLEAQRQALAALKQLADEIAASVESLLSRISRALMSAEEASWRDEVTVYGAPDKIAAATTAADVKRLTEEALAAAERLFEEMLANLKAARAAQADLNSLVAEMEGRTFSVSFNARDMAESWEGVYDLQRRAADAARLSGRAQIDAIAGVTQDARTLWEANQAILQRITDNVRNLAKSIEQQKWEIDMGALNPQEQATALAARIVELRNRIAGATTPEEVAALTSELQGLVARYMGLFSNESNPEVAAAAREWAKEQLTFIEDMARKAYEAMNAYIKAANEELLAILKQLGPALSGTIAGIQADIESLRGIIGWIGTVAHETLEGFAEDIVEAGAEFIRMLEEATRLFTDLNDVLGDGGDDGSDDTGDTGEGGDDGGGDDGDEQLTENLARASEGAGALGDAASSAAASQLRLRDNAEALSASLERLLAVLNTGSPGTAGHAVIPGAGILETLRQAGPRMVFTRGTGR